MIFLKNFAIIYIENKEKSYFEREVIIMFVIIYTDNANRTHYTVARNMTELNFFRNHFEVIEIYAGSC